MIVRELRRLRFRTLFLVLLPEPGRFKCRRLLVIGIPGATVDHVRALFTPQEGSESEPASPRDCGEASSHAKDEGAPIARAIVRSEET